MVDADRAEREGMLQSTEYYSIECSEKLPQVRQGHSS